MSEFKLTIRVGPRVERESHETLADAVAALSERVEALRAGEDLPSVKMLREFEPHQRVKGRVEISTGSIFRRREAGVDVMGDGTVVPYRGGTFKDHLDPPEGVSYEDAVLDALRE